MTDKEKNWILRKIEWIKKGAESEGRPLNKEEEIEIFDLDLEINGAWYTQIRYENEHREY